MSIRVALARCVVASTVLVPWPAAAGLLSHNDFAFSLNLRTLGPILNRDEGARPKTADEWTGADALAGADDAGADDAGAALRAAPIFLPADIFGQGSFGATLEPGEPRFGGRMRATVWFRHTATAPGRMIFATFGTTYDTALAVHRGTVLRSLVTLGFSDNISVSGQTGLQSLVSARLVAGQSYAIQVGSPKGQTGLVRLAAARVPDAGGLAVFPADQGVRDFVCGINDGSIPSCSTATYILHNSRTQTLRVITGHDLGSGIVTPGSIDIAPGATAVVTFTFAEGFDRTTPRTVAGFFRFAGRLANGTAVNTVWAPATLAIEKPQPGSSLTATVDPTMQGSGVADPRSFVATLSNAGGTALQGCHARRGGSRLATVAWRSLGSNGKPVAGSLGKPFAIVPRGQKRIQIELTSSEQRRPDADFATSAVHFDCAATAPAPVTLQNNFDVSAVGSFTPALLDTGRILPRGNLLSVRAGGSTVFRVTAINRGPQATVQVQARYFRPFDDTAPNRQFQVSICELGTTGRCLAAATPSVDFVARTGATHRFQVTVRAAQTNPGFDPDRRRIAAYFFQVAPDTDLESFVPLAAEGIPIRQTP